MNHNILHTPLHTCIAAVMDAIEKHGRAGVLIDDEGGLRVGDPKTEVMRAYEANHPHLTMTTYTRATRPCDVLGDFAARLDELSTYGMDKQRKKR